MSLERVLIATDLSDRSLAIARSAIDLARAHGATATVLHAISPLTNLITARDAHAGWLDNAVARAEERLADIEGATVEVVVGQPVAAIIELAASEHVDVVILGARAPDDPWRMLVGSTSLQAARALRCPALITREPFATSRFLRPLVAVDLTELSEPAVTWAAELSEPGSSVELIHVIETEALPEELREVAEHTRSETLDRLESFVREIDLATVPINPRAELGRVTEQILEAVELTHSDLVIVGARRRDRPDTVLGTIADRVLRLASTPVLIIPP